MLPTVTQIQLHGDHSYWQGKPKTLGTADGTTTRMSVSTMCRTRRKQFDVLRAEYLTS